MVEPKRLPKSFFIVFVRQRPRLLKNMNEFYRRYVPVPPPAVDRAPIKPNVPLPHERPASTTHAAAGGAGAAASDATPDAEEMRLLQGMGLRVEDMANALPMLRAFVAARGVQPQPADAPPRKKKALRAWIRKVYKRMLLKAEEAKKEAHTKLEAAEVKERAAADAHAAADAKIQDANARPGILADMGTHELRARELGRRLEMVREMTAAIHDLSAYMIRNRRFDPRFQVALQDAAKNVIIDGTASLDHRYGLSISCEALLIQIALTLDELKLVGELMDKFHHSPHPQHLKYIGGGTYMVNTYFIEDRDNMRAMIRDVDATRGQPRHIVFARAAARLGHAGA